MRLRQWKLIHHNAVNLRVRTHLHSQQVGASRYKRGVDVNMRRPDWQRTLLLPNRLTEHIE